MQQDIRVIPGQIQLAADFLGSETLVMEIQNPGVTLINCKDFSQAVEEVILQNGIRLAAEGILGVFGGRHNYISPPLLLADIIQ